jgi:excisionase family DNA binding protein
MSGINPTKRFDKPYLVVHFCVVAFIRDGNGGDMREVKRELKGDWLTVTEAGHVLGLSRNSAYKAASRGDFPIVRLGKKILVPTAPLRKMLGLGAEAV